MVKHPKASRIIALQYHKSTIVGRLINEEIRKVIAWPCAKYPSVPQREAPQYEHRIHLTSVQWKQHINYISLSICTRCNLIVELDRFQQWCNIQIPLLATGRYPTTTLSLDYYSVCYGCDRVTCKCTACARALEPGGALRALCTCCTEYVVVL